MKRLIGIAIGSADVRVLSLHRGRIERVSEVLLEHGGSLENAVREALAELALPRRARPTVRLVLGPSRSQVRRLTELPQVKDPRVLAQVVREGAGTFFLRTGEPQLISGVDVLEPGCVWAAVLDAEAVRSAERACRSVSMTLASAAPLAAALPGALDGQVLSWRDGDVHLVVELGPEGKLRNVRRLRGPHSLDHVTGFSRTRPPLEPLGEYAERFTDAYAAAVLDPTEPLSTKLPGYIGSHPARTLRVALAGGALVCASVLAWIAPGLRWGHMEALAIRELRGLSEERLAIATTQRELASLTEALHVVERLRGSSASPVLLLARVTQALPAGTALLTLRVDSAGGTLVALTPRAGAVLTALESLPELESPEIVGPVTREMAAMREVERVSLRFRLSPPNRSRVGAGVP